MNEPLASAAGNAVEVMQRGRFPDRPPPRSAAPRGDRRARRGDAASSAALPTTPRAARERSRKPSTPAARPRSSAGWSRRSADPPISSSTREVHLDARRAHPARASRSSAGIVSAIDTRAIGIAVIELGGGRAAGKRSDRSRRRLHAARAGRRGSRARPPARHGACAERCRCRARRGDASVRLHDRLWRDVAQGHLRADRADLAATRASRAEADA